MNPKEIVAKDLNGLEVKISRDKESSQEKNAQRQEKPLPLPHLPDTWTEGNPLNFLQLYPAEKNASKIKAIAVVYPNPPVLPEALRRIFLAEAPYKKENEASDSFTVYQMLKAISLENGSAAVTILPEAPGFFGEWVAYAGIDMECLFFRITTQDAKGFGELKFELANKMYNVQDIQEKEAEQSLTVKIWTGDPFRKRSVLLHLFGMIDDNVHPLPYSVRSRLYRYATGLSQYPLGDDLKRHIKANIDAWLKERDGDDFKKTPYMVSAFTHAIDLAKMSGLTDFVYEIAEHCARENLGKYAIEACNEALRCLEKGYSCEDPSLEIKIHQLLAQNMLNHGLNRQGVSQKSIREKQSRIPDEAAIFRLSDEELQLAEETWAKDWREGISQHMDAALKVAMKHSAPKESEKSAKVSASLDSSPSVSEKGNPAPLLHVFEAVKNEDKSESKRAAKPRYPVTQGRLVERRKSY